MVFNADRDGDQTPGPGGDAPGAARIGWPPIPAASLAGVIDMVVVGAVGIGGGAVDWFHGGEK